MSSNFPLAPFDGDEKRQPSVVHLPVTSGQTFIAGALVVLASGALSECGADPSVAYGVALAPASATTLYANARIPVAVLQPNTLWVIGSSTTPAATHVGAEYGVVKSTNWLLDTTEVTATCFRIVDYAPKTGAQGQERFIVTPQTAFANVANA